MCGALFWSTFLIDWAYFRLTATELPRWFREAVAVSAITLVAAGLVFWIVLRYFARFRSRGFGPRARATISRTRHAAHHGRRNGFVAQRSRIASDLRHDRADNRRGRSLVVVVAARDRSSTAPRCGGRSLPRLSWSPLLPASRLVDRAAVSRWGRAFVSQDAVYWTRETQLVVKAVVQPGDRVREFHDGRLKHPRGVDLVLLVEAPEGTKVPPSVELNYALDGGGTGRMEMVKSHRARVPSHDFRLARQPFVIGCRRRLCFPNSVAG